MINPAALIDDINAIALKLEGFVDKAGNPIPLDRETIAALRARADIKFKLLGKVLPDLKATESVSHNLHDHNHQHVHTKVSNVELAQRLQLWRRQQEAAIIESAPEGTSDDSHNPADPADPDWL